MRFLSAGIIILLLSACLSEPDCLVAASGNVKIVLQKEEDGTPKKALFSAITVSGLAATFQSTDSLSSMALPLNPFTTETTFSFDYSTRIDGVDTSRTDSVTFSYTTENIIISPACGGYVYYSNLLILSSSFENIKVVNNQLSTASAPNIQIRL